MTGRADNILSRWAVATGLAGGAAMMTGRGVGDNEQDASRVFAPAWIGLMVLSLGWGLLTIGVYVLVRLAPGVGVSRPLWIPAGVLAALSLAGPYRCAALDVAGLLGLRGRVARAGFVVLVAAGWAAAMAYLRLDRHTGLASEEQALPEVLSWMRPELEAFRVLLLTPLWGAWAMMIAAQFCRPGANSPAPMRAFARGCGPMLSVTILSALLCGSIVYFSFLPWHQLTISAAAILGGIAAGALAARRAGGLTRGALLAANLGAQVAFVLVYLANVAR